MAVFLINPSDHSFGTAVITPRWLYVLAAATPGSFGDPVIVDETLEALVPSGIQAGDFVGIGIHTGNALRGYEVGRLARERGAWAFTRRFTPRKRWSVATRTAWLRVMATSSGPRCWTRAS
jgi:hypothetical protein